MTSYANIGFELLIAGPRKRLVNGAWVPLLVPDDAVAGKAGCCDGCDEAEAQGRKTPCAQAAERTALIAGVTSELATAKWFLDNRWYIIGGTFAAGGLFFASVSYFVNRNP